MAVPSARAAGLVDLEVVVDSHERYPYRFTDQQVTTTRAALPAGDYGVLRDGMTSRSGIVPPFYEIADSRNAEDARTRERSYETVVDCPARTRSIIRLRSPSPIALRCSPMVITA